MPIGATLDKNKLKTKHMKTYKIVLHSHVGLITNSSTVIFTYSEGSYDAVKELVNEMLKVFGEDKTFDDLFYAEVFLESCDDYFYSFEDKDDEELRVEGFDEELIQINNIEDWKEKDGKQNDYITELKKKILTKEISKPEWMIKIEDNEDDEGYKNSSALEIMPKDEKYSELANKLLKYLYSTDHEATGNG